MIGLIGNIPVGTSVLSMIVWSLPILGPCLDVWCVLDPLQMESRVPVRVKTGGTAVGVAYWFTLQLYGEIAISTYQPEKVERPVTRQCVVAVEISLSLFPLPLEDKPLAPECVPVSRRHDCVFWSSVYFENIAKGQLP